MLFRSNNTPINNPSVFIPGGGQIDFTNPDLPALDSGGIVPGPTGSDQLILAHGGETVLPTHKPGFGLPTVPTGPMVTANITLVDVGVNTLEELVELARRQ